VRGGNPPAFHDLGPLIFTTASPAAQEAVVALLAQHGGVEHFQISPVGIQCSILWDCTIIGTSDHTVPARRHRNWHHRAQGTRRDELAAVLHWYAI
jgi:hypothetical protein